MLTREEQLQVIELVRKMLRNDRIRRSKVKSMLISEKSAKESEQEEFAELRELLKELG